MKMTNHAIIRSQQRGILEDNIDLVLRHGQPTRRPGGAREYRLRKKDINLIVSSLKRKIQLLDKAKGLAVIVSEDGTVITTYHSS